MNITDKQIDEGLMKAYELAGHNAYFGNGFKAGVKFALKLVANNDESDKIERWWNGLTQLQKIDAENKTFGQGDEFEDNSLTYADIIKMYNNQ